MEEREDVDVHDDDDDNNNNDEMASRQRTVPRVVYMMRKIKTNLMNCFPSGFLLLSAIRSRSNRGIGTATATNSSS